MRTALAVGAVALGLFGSACAPALPTFAGATTTPEHRGDLLAGASYRVAVAGLQRVASSSDPPAHALESFAAREGAVPAAAARYGVGRRADLGVMASGTGASIELRYAALLDEGERFHVLVAVRGFGMWTTGDGASGALGGLDVPALFTVSISGLYELWLGGHLAGLAGAGDLNGQRADAAGLRVGGIVGLSLGFQSFAVLVELAADYELWTGHAIGQGLSRDGFVLTPALAVRFRL